jgi:Na+-driven multidrug efflux pump
MFFGIIALRILFAACMVFIIGYVFGGFSRSAALTTITKVASILAIVLFIVTNVFVMRGMWRHRMAAGEHACWNYQGKQVDSLQR